MLLSLRCHNERAADAELLDIRESVAQSSHGWEKMQEPHVRRAIFVGIGLSVIQQITGVNAVNFFAQDVLEAAGFAQKAALEQAIFIGVCKVCCDIHLGFL